MKSPAVWLVASEAPEKLDKQQLLKLGIGDTQHLTVESTFNLAITVAGIPSIASALCNFRADDALGSVLLAPITVQRFVRLNNRPR